MTKISVSATLAKSLFILATGGFLVYALINPLGQALLKLSPLAILVPIIYFIVIVLFYIKDVSKLVDAYDNGDRMLFRRGKIEQEVALSDIVNIDHPAGSPFRAKLQVRSKSSIGQSLSFMLPIRFNLLKKDQYIVNLIERVDRARRT